MSLRVSKGVRSIYDRIVHMFVDLQPEEETEARFGHMKGSTFVPGITEKNYMSLLSSFSKSNKWKKNVEVVTTDFCVDVEGGKVRKRIEEIKETDFISCSKTIYCIKKASTPYRMFYCPARNVYIRVSRSKEIPTTEEEFSKHASETKISYIKKKERVIFERKSTCHWKIELIKSVNNNSKCEYYVELECANNVLAASNTEFIAADMMEKCLDILGRTPNTFLEPFPKSVVHTISQTLVPANKDSFMRKVQEEYRELVGVSQFVGPMPSALSIDKIRKIMFSNYAITDKTDGNRVLIFVTTAGSMFSLQRNNKWKNLDVHIPSESLKEYAHTLLDAELISEPNTDIKVVVFDCLFYCTNDKRMCTLWERLRWSQQFCKNIKSDIISHKYFYWVGKDGIVCSRHCDMTYDTLIPIDTLHINSFGDMAVYMWMNRKKHFIYNIDGLVFTPINEYYSNKLIYKWKETNTVDFYYEKLEECVWKLYIGAFDKNGEYSNIAFSGVDGNGTSFVKKKIPVVNSIFKDTEINALCRYGIIHVEKNVSIKFKNRGIAEFQFEEENLTFVPIGERNDKNFPNNIVTINQTWISIRDCTTLDDFHNPHGIKRRREMRTVLDNFI